MARIYISYRHDDIELAQRFAAELRRTHLCTLDADYLVLGQEWRRALQEAFAAADALVVLLTPNSVDLQSEHISSQYIAADVGKARAAGKLVMPIVLRGTPLPNLVSDIHAKWMADESDSEVLRMVAAISDGLARHEKLKEHPASLLLPEGYRHLVDAVRQFHEDGPYEKSVFVMMKFPDIEARMEDRHRRLLNDIWRVVNDTVAASGLVARRADKKDYHDQLWENTCVHMFGSRYGMAILEDRVASELNPNVALEYGFMKALNRTVGLFRSEDFQHDRADLTGKLSVSFKIGADDRLDEQSLENAINHWLRGAVPVKPA